MEHKLPDITEYVFHSPTKGVMAFDALLAEIARYIAEEPNRSYKLVIGSDSTASASTRIATVVIIHRLGCGARYFYTHSPLQVFQSLRDRIFAEAMASITLGQELRTRLRDELGSDIMNGSTEVHVDVGENGPTKELIESITGMLRGFDFIPVIKPDSYAAFSVADRHV